MSENKTISSGALEALALEMIPTSEQFQLQRELAGHSESRKELAEIEATLDTISRQLAIDPPEKLKKQLISRVTATSADTKVVPIAARRWKTLTGIAAALVLMLSVVLTISTKNYRDIVSERDALLLEKQQIADNLTQTKATIQAKNDQLALYSDNKTQRVLLTGTDNSPASSLRVLYAANGEVYIDAINLPPLAAGKQYQLWGIVNGQPVDAGIFDPVDGLISMKQLQDAAAFAVTIEPIGGSQVPTLDTMVVIGEV